MFLDTSFGLPQTLDDGGILLFDFYCCLVSFTLILKVHSRRMHLSVKEITFS